jgi:hypothetical protein
MCRAGEHMMALSVHDFVAARAESELLGDELCRRLQRIRGHCFDPFHGSDALERHAMRMHADV